MTPSKIIEGNILIAEFMQREYERIYDLNYRCSWDWLMPVVERIENVHFEGTENEAWVDVLIQSNTCHIIEETQVFNTLEKIAGTKLEAVWLAVIDFIKWYNQQNPKP